MDASWNIIEIVWLVIMAVYVLYVIPEYWKTNQHAKEILDTKWAGRKEALHKKQDYEKRAEFARKAHKAHKASDEMIFNTLKG